MTVIPIVIGGQGVVSKKFKSYVKGISGMLKITILESNQILRKFL